MTTNGFVRARDAEAARLTALFDTYAANAQTLRAMRPALLCEHPGETVLVTDAGATVRFYPDMEALVAAVPHGEREGAAYDLLMERPPILIV